MSGHEKSGSVDAADAAATDGKDGPNDPLPRRNLADLVDDLLITYENWRGRPMMSVLLIAVAGALAGAGWWSSHRVPSTDSVEAAIPYASESPSRPAPTTAPGAAATESPPSAPPLGSASDPGIATVPAIAGEAAPTMPSIVVHVSGEVLRPGLVNLPGESRIAEAIEAAGGPTPSGDVHRLNLAALVVDGTQIVVPSTDEVVDGPLVRTSGSWSASDEPSTEPGLVNLNSASRVQLESLPGVGPATATAIETWREQHGGFRSVEELLDVPGIGPAKLDALVDLVEV